MISLIKMVIINGIMGTSIMDSGNLVKCMELGNFIGKMDYVTRDSIWTILNMAKDKWSGILILGTGAIGPTVINMAMENKLKSLTNKNPDI